MSKYLTISNIGNVNVRNSKPFVKCQNAGTFNMLIHVPYYAGPMLGFTLAPKCCADLYYKQSGLIFSCVEQYLS